jgi:hypothetical protein
MQMSRAGGQENVFDKQILNASTTFCWATQQLENLCGQKNHTTLQ